ncbi:MAG: hypothetical protein NZV14_07925 [Bryobacteraceae bacterium]|nr:hypothetical protein [Bryobacteraceae bacterium]MDW8378074.1 hypothetical protein [Bryobacterales bacterium]
MAVTLAGASFGGYSIWKAHQQLRVSEIQQSGSSEIRYSVRSVQPRAVEGLELVTPRLTLRDFDTLDGKWYVLTAHRLLEVDSEGHLKNAFRCGLELPATPLQVMAAGVLAGAQRRELFIATAGAGLLIFDGSAFRQLLPELQAARRITAILPLESGQLLIGTDKAGLLVWDGAQLRWFHESLKDVSVTALAGQLDSLWIGTLDQGVIHAQGGQIERFEDLPDRHVHALASVNGRAFAATLAGVSELGADGKSVLIAPGIFPRDLQADEHTLWIGTFEDGLWEMPLAAGNARPRRTSAGDSEIRRLKLSGQLLVAVLEHQLFVRESGNWRNLALQTETAAPLTDAMVTSIALDNTGRVWLGYFDRGLDIWDPVTQRVTHFEDDHLFCVNRIALRQDGAVIATANGLVITDRSGKTRQVITKSQGLISNHATDVLLEEAGMVVATSAGITFLNSGGASSVHAFHGLVNNHVYTLASLRGKLLAGALGGASILESGIVKASYTTANSVLKHNWISAAVTVGEEIFAGTYGAGIYRFDGASWYGFADLREGFEVNPNAMTFSARGVFAGTVNNGLAVYNRATNRWSFFTEGLPSLNVTAVAAGAGTLYLGTDQGLVRVAEGRTLPL